MAALTLHSYAISVGSPTQWGKPFLSLPSDTAALLAPLIYADDAGRLFWLPADKPETGETLSMIDRATCTYNVGDMNEEQRDCGKPAITEAQFEDGISIRYCKRHWLHIGEHVKGFKGVQVLDLVPEVC